MTEHRVETKRSDLDVEHDIHELIHTYAPLRHDRHRVHFTVMDGNVSLGGYVKATPTYEFLVNNIGLVPGVKLVDHSNLHQDEVIRREVGRVVPLGVQVNVEYGAVILAGKLPEDVSFEDLAQKVGQVAGVNRVVSSFS
jgi:osmotically-inducible protein OsmY